VGSYIGYLISAAMLAWCIYAFWKHGFFRQPGQARFNADSFGPSCSVCAESMHKFSLIFQPQNTPTLILKDQDDVLVGTLDGVLVRKKDSQGRPVPAARKTNRCCITFSTMVFESADDDLITSFLMEYHKGVFTPTHFAIRRWSDSVLMGTVAFRKNAPSITGSGLAADIQVDAQSAGAEPGFGVAGPDGDCYAFSSEKGVSTQGKIVKTVTASNYQLLLKSSLSNDQKALALASLLSFRQQHLCEGFGPEG